MRKRSFATTQFGEWLTGQMEERNINVASLSRVSGIDATRICRIRKGTPGASEDAVLKVILALGHPNPQALSILNRFRIGTATAKPERDRQLSSAEDWEHLCITLKVIGNYPTVEEALKVAISRELTSVTNRQD